LVRWAKEPWTVSSETGSGTARKRYLLFHKSISNFSFASTNFSPRRLKRLLVWLRESGFVFEGIDDQGRTAAERVIGLTFDDGYEHLASVLPPLVEEFGIRPLIFVPTAFIGKAADWDYSYRFCKVSHLERRSIRSLSASAWSLDRMDTAIPT
jgi:hypothetical protein